jgi:DNA-binding NarL/FixJ family response regulator
LLILIVILLCLNFIGILYLIFKNSNTDNHKTNDQNLLKKQDQLNREINELKGTLNFLRSWLEKDYQKIKTELQALGSINHERNTSKYKPNLFLNDRYKEVFDLYEKGLSADEIAKKLGKGSGEIEFILQLASQDRT